MGYGDSVSKASSGIKLIKWLANQADDVVASADDLEEFGPQAAKVRAFLDFIPTLSNDARDLAGTVRQNPLLYPRSITVSDDVVARFPKMKAAAEAARRVSLMDAGYNRGAIVDVAQGEAASDLLTPKQYLFYVNNLNTARVFDQLLLPKHRLADTPFVDLIRSISAGGGVRNPLDVSVISNIAREPKDIQEIARQLMIDSEMDPRQVIKTSRLLA